MKKNLLTALSIISLFMITTNVTQTQPTAGQAKNGIQEQIKTIVSQYKAGSLTPANAVTQLQAIGQKISAKLATVPQSGTLTAAQQKLQQKFNNLQTKLNAALQTIPPTGTTPTGTTNN